MPANSKIWASTPSSIRWVMAASMPTSSVKEGSVNACSIKKRHTKRPYPLHENGQHLPRRSVGGGGSKGSHKTPTHRAKTGSTYPRCSVVRQRSKGSRNLPHKNGQHVP